MSASLIERSLLAVAALLQPIKPPAGYRTHIGFDVRVSPVLAQMHQVQDEIDAPWQTLVYTAEEVLQGPGGRAVRGGGPIQVQHVISIDCYTASEAGREAVQMAQIRADVRRALSPHGPLVDADGRIGEIEHRGSQPIPEALESGLVGLRTTIVVHYVEAWGDPAASP
jgi:hypothetical protein